MNQLAEIVKTSGLEIVEGQSIIDRFGDYESIAKEWKIKAEQIVVTDRSQTTEMAMAKEARKKFSELRCDVEKARKQMKEQSLRKGQAIDAIARFLTSLISPIEDHLRAQEDFIKIEDAKKAEEARIAAEKKIEEEKIAKEKAEKEAQEKIRLENEKLRIEADKLQKEKEKIQRELESKKLEEARKKKEAEDLENKRIMEEKKSLEAEMKKPDEQKYNAYIQKLLDIKVPIIKNTEINNKVNGVRSLLKKEIQ